MIGITIAANDAVPLLTRASDRAVSRGDLPSIHRT
jgi:hypothetical protein